MSAGDADAPRLDVALALRQMVLAFWHDFAPIVPLGFVMVTLPAVALHLIGSHSGSTILATFGGMLGVLYGVIVTVGTLARLSGRPFTPRLFVRAGIVASPQGLSVALLLGAATVLTLVGLLLAGLTAPYAKISQLLIVAAAFLGLVVVLPAVPAAIVERRTPLAALRRAAALTRGDRGRIAAVVLVLLLAVVPARIVVAASIYGLAASLARTAAVDAGMTLFSPGLWLLALFDLLAVGLAATLPAVVYVQLARR